MLCCAVRQAVAGPLWSVRLRQLRQALELRAVGEVRKMLDAALASATLQAANPLCTLGRTLVSTRASLIEFAGGEHARAAHAARHARRRQLPAAQAARVEPRPARPPERPRRRLFARWPAAAANPCRPLAPPPEWGRGAAGTTFPR